MHPLCFVIEGLACPSSSWKAKKKLKASVKIGRSEELGESLTIVCMQMIYYDIIWFQMNIYKPWNTLLRKIEFPSVLCNALSQQIFWIPKLQFLALLLHPYAAKVETILSILIAKTHNAK